jgi:N-acetylglucosaminyldiphosphoundecaprenol N-acetyl-beta-D-mannosaminyltransferase
LTGTSVTSRRHDVLGVSVDAVTRDELLDEVATAITGGRGHLVANHHLHSARLIRDDPPMRDFYAAADTIVIDGMPLVWFGRALGHRLERRHRITCVDSIPALLARAATSGWSTYVLASAPDVHDRGMAVVRDRFPGLDVQGHHGWFEMGSADDDRVLAEICAARPDLLLVGMGMPRQERWLSARLRELRAADVGVVVTVGGWLDYEAGARATPPRWMGRLGFEWLARLVDEPRRLGHRYLVEPWALAPTAVRELWRARATRGR